ncbi:adenosine deaminase [Paenibacillus soyae]|uniref:adenosine deaminase n=1 Tax=Paenibacillus soyae TaxID=2969249 RepID=A0A9X2MSN1_9BACL|nr:adenosine deaminase [Paenibacillus soyae]MCR2805502.1 adenosine deaminase [Paenibacillus soyae]
MEDRILAMPKVDLHVHLDGSVRPETVIALAREGGHKLPAWDPGLLAPYMRAEGDCDSLTDYLSKFHFVGQFLHTSSSLTRTAYEVVAQSAAHNCRYVEVRFAPQLHRKLGLSVADAIRAVLEGLRQGERDFGVVARCIAICLRGHSEELNREVIREAAHLLGKGVVAVDLAGAEAAYPPELYRDIFAMARERGLPITIHAGEAAGASSVRSAVELLGAQRVGHGVRMKEDPAVVELILRAGIPLEMCPKSNLQTKAAESWVSYPLRDYFDRGIAVTVNTDNLTVSNTTITQEYALLRDELGFRDEELAQIAMNGAAAAFVQGEEKRRLLEGMKRDMAEWLGSPSAS